MAITEQIIIFFSGGESPTLISEAKFEDDSLVLKTVYFYPSSEGYLGPGQISETVYFGSNISMMELFMKIANSF